METFLTTSINKGLNLTHEKTPRGKTRKDMKRYGKTRKIHYKTRKRVSTEYWTSHMKRHEDERHEKTWKDTKRHEKKRKIHYKMRKDRIYIDKICFI